MRTFTLARPGQYRRSPLLAYGFFIFVMIVAYEVSLAVVNGDFKEMAYIAIGAGGVMVAVITLRNWKTGLLIFLIWLSFEDFARKFLGNNMIIYFAKDVLAALVYLSFFLAFRRKDKHTKLFRPPFLAALLVLIWFGVIQMFNTASPSVFYGMLGMKIYFYYVPLLFLGYAMVESEQDLRRFFYINLGIALVVVVIGIAQSIIGPEFLSPAVLAEDIRLLSQTYRVDPTTGIKVYRPTSVFVSAGRFSDFLILQWILIFGFSGYLLLRQRKGRIWTFFSLGMTAAGCVMCASRGAFMWAMINALVGGGFFLWGTGLKREQLRRILRNLQRAAAGIALGLVILLIFYPDAILNRLAIYSNTLSPGSANSELVYRARDYPLQNFIAAFSYPRWPYGYGIGSSSLGMQYASRILHLPLSGVGVESGFGALVVEMGIGGLLLWLFMSGAIVVAAWKVVRKLRGSPWFPIAFMIFWYAFILLIPLTFLSMNSYQDFVLNAYLWLTLGILFRLPTLALSVQSAAGNQAAAPGGSRVR